ncbi:ribokinase [Heliomicrobium modesticaldum Ice1]|uniref:Ribokinase n=1 Tax=Heliobacterium modesticaldum (strain ATCC 51547 / Ice1) TaxID=498761 RepID=B0TIM5_HELMI|nr:ribokinase [Heliomicrobium modesticaldum]ABZ84966.1 ribokinase [Heliomicrobium modesticaldum Ice1]
MTKPRLLVIGSINVDLVAYAERIPHTGETVKGKQFSTIPGGKGANQAMAANRLGAEVTFLGAVGDDGYGKDMLRYFRENGLDPSRVKQVPGSTGVAMIVVDDAGNNQIVVVPGANDQLKPADLEACADDFSAADVVVIQLETPLETVGKAIELAAFVKKPLILNPAPAQKLPEDWLRSVTYLVPNEHEAALLGGDPGRNFADLQEKMTGTLIVTMGEKGVLFNASGLNDSGDSNLRRIPAFSVPVVDTTAAGDAFVAGFAVALAEGQPLEEALRFASAVAALSVTKAGAQTSLPLREEVNRFLEGLT